MRVSERIYRILIPAYTARYCRAYGEPMVQLFRDRLGETASGWGLPRLWLHALTDLAVTLPARYWEAWIPRVHGSRFTLPVRRAVFFARYEASSFGRREITVEHLLLGVLREDRRWISPSAAEVIRHQIETAESNARRVPPEEDLPLAIAGRRVLRAALREAGRSGTAHVEPRHLLAGILQQKGGRAAQLVRDQGLDLAQLRSDAHIPPSSAEGP